MKSILSWIRSLFRKKSPTHIEDEVRTVDDSHLPVSLPIPTRDGDEYKVWIPFAENAHKTEGIKMRSRGEYSEGYPKGLVVHFNSGWHLKRGTHLRPFPITNIGLGIAKMARRYGLQTLSGGLKNGYLFLSMDVLGKIYQSRPLTKWGYHAGKSYWKTVGSSVSNDFAGVEILNPSTLSIKNGKFITWFKYVIPNILVREAEARDNIAKGYYHVYSIEQEKSLLKLCVWLYNNSPTKGGEKVFKIENIVGHDEVSPGRKNDPGHALSCSMPEFRIKVEREILKGTESYV